MTILSSLFASTNYLIKIQSVLFTDARYPSQIPEATLVITPSHLSVGAKFTKLELHCATFQRRHFEEFCLHVLNSPPASTDFDNFRLKFLA